MWIWLSMALAAFSLCLFCWWFGRPYIDGTHNGAQSLRVLPLRLMWPWVDALARVCQPLMSWHLRLRLQRLLQQAGVGPPWSAQHLCAWQCLLALVVASLAFLLLAGSMSLAAAVVLAIAAAGLAAAWPLQRLREHIQRRKNAMVREFPFMLDMVTLCVEAGLNLHGALQQAALHGPPGPLREELRHMLSDVRAGVSRQDALSSLATRCDLAPLHHFVASMAQADQAGMSLGPVLRAQSDQRRSERFLRAERLALEAPVKMMFPLVFCIFPCSFVIIAFPIAVQFTAMWE